MARGRNLDIAGRQAGGVRWNPALIFDPVLGNVFGPANNPSGAYGTSSPFSGGLFPPAPLQLSEPWSEYAFTGALTNLPNPPWSFSAGVTASQPTHTGGANDIHSNDNISRTDQFVGSINYVTDSLQHVDVTRAVRFSWSQKFQADGTGFNNGMQFGWSMGALVSVTVACNGSTGASSISAAATGLSGFVAFNYTDDFSIRSYQIDIGNKDSGGAGKQTLKVRMNNVVVASGTITNLANGGGGVAFTLSPAFTQRLNNRVYTLFPLQLYYTRM